MFSVARLGCEPEARALLDRGAAIDAKDREGATALGRAAQAGKIAVAALLIDRGAEVNARAVDGSTPLFYAAEADRGAAIRLLLDRGADPNIPGRKGARPLAAAAYNGSAESVELLLKHGADPNALDDDGKSAMIYAAGRAYAPVVELLIAAGVDVNRRYAHGLTALMWAAGHDVSAGVDDVEATLKLLIERGAALELKDDRGKTAADIARGSHCEMTGRVKLLRRNRPRSQKPARYFAIEASWSDVHVFMRSDMPGLLARVPLRNSLIVFARYSGCCPARRGTDESP